jgi:hypothetical protein
VTFLSLVSNWRQFPSAIVGASEVATAACLKALEGKGWHGRQP